MQILSTVHIGILFHTTTETMTIRIAIIEDTASYRKAIAAMLDQADDFECVAKFSSAEEAINQTMDYRPDVVLMDIGLPKMSGIEAIKALKSVMPSIRKPAPPEEALELTPRERELLDYLAKGYTYKEIGNKLFISEHTVRTHIHRIYEKRHVRRRTEALHKVFQNRQ